MAAGLQVLHEETLGPLDRDRHAVALLGELTVEFIEPRHVVGDSQLQLLVPGCIHDTQLMLVSTPVDPGEDATVLHRIHATSDPGRRHLRG